MARRDGYSRGLESLEDIRASDRFIEQLRVSGTYEPSSRTDATLAAALLTWRDEARDEPLTPPPSVEEIGSVRPFVQPRRILRRSVAVAGVLLAMSSAVATAVDGDPLRPVEFLVDFGVDVGERIVAPDTESSSGDVPGETFTGDDGGSHPYSGEEPDTSAPDEPLISAPNPESLTPPGQPGTDETPADDSPSIISPTEDQATEDGGETTPPPDDDGTTPPPDDDGTTPPPDDTTPPPPPDDTTPPPPPDDTTPPPPPDDTTPPPAGDGGEGEIPTSVEDPPPPAEDDNSNQSDDQQLAPPEGESGVPNDDGQLLGPPEHSNGDDHFGDATDEFGDDNYDLAQLFEGLPPEVRYWLIATMR
jgi:Anti-sigma-D factor RsdA to sigma factor binding region